jgi:hypothetical protein
VAAHKCPHCGVSLVGDEIPEEHRRPGGYTRYAREIGIEVRGVYDGILFWQCPDCDGRWHRFAEGHWLRSRAERYIDR